MGLLKRVTEPTVDVLRVLIGAREPVWGLRVIKATGLKAGSVYPILSRLEDGGWVSAEWEAEDTRSGPRRRLYELTEDGRREATAVVAVFDEKARQTAVSSLRPQTPRALA